MKIIGITGGTGCGKTTALTYLQQMGAYIIDCDAVYHDLLTTSPSMRRDIANTFPDCFDGDTLDRKKLGSQVFADPVRLQALNEITHAYVFRAVQEILEEADRAGCPACAIDAIGLLESGLTLLCHTTVAITAPQEQRLQRLMQRDHISLAYAKARIDAQRSNEEYSAMCRHTLCNDADQAAFKDQCNTLFTQLLQERSFHCERE